MKKHLFPFCLSIFSIFMACGQEHPSEKVVQNEPPITISNEYTHEVVVSGLTIPWGFDFLPDGSMLITDKSGELFHFADGEKKVVSGGPEVYVRGQGGLMDVRVSPQFSETNYVYITYSSSAGENKGGHTALMRAKFNNNNLSEQEVLYKAVPNTTKGQHWGSRIVFDKEGHLFFSIGERGEREVNPQDITRDGGKIYRLNLDGSIPEDNPFVGKKNAVEAIWSYGHRNPQGMAVHPKTGEIYANEHGPRGGDEINIIEKGANYGWPVITYGINYSGTPVTDEVSKPMMKQPLYYWVPSIAPSGMAFVTGDQYPKLTGGILVGSLKFTYLEHLRLDGKKVISRQKLLDGIGRVRSVRQGPDGYVYAGVEGVGIVKMLKK